MHRLLISILICLSLNFQYLALFSQVSDDFSDGDFTINPVWSGDTANFIVSGAAFLLQLSAPAAADVSYLSTPSQSVNSATWEFYAEMAFNPSSSNYAKVYIVSDRADLKNSLDGYFVKLGGTTDEISLFRQDGLTETEVIEGMDGRLNTAQVKVRVKITRDDSGNWTLLSDTAGGTNYITEGSAVDDTYSATRHFGVSCVYTSTRSTSFYFDDFIVTGNPFVDTIPPAVDTVMVLSANSLVVWFSEAVEQTSSENVLNYSVSNGIGNPTSAVRDITDSSRVALTFSNAFQNGIINTLAISNIADSHGNVLAPASKDFLFFNPSTPGYHDVIITEIFPDPDPQVALPDAEFVEIYNRSGNVFDLSGWTFSDAGTSAALGFFALLPGDYLILCSAAAVSDYQHFGNVLGASLPVLNNDGDALSLKDASGNIIFHVEYSGTWYRDEIKNDGGWSLEMIDTGNPCGGASNWRASQDARGGTPGQPNSVNAANPDASAPSLLYVAVLDSMNLNLNFDETLDGSSAANPANYSLNYGIAAASASFTNLTRSGVALGLASPLQRDIIYTLTVDGVMDCSGNFIGVNNTAQFGLPETPDSFDIIINEILSNPVSGGSDFIELCNRSQKIIDLKDVIIAGIDEDDGDTSAVAVSTRGFQLLPGNYAALTANPEHIITRYFTPNPKFVIEVPGIPSFDDDEDIVAIFSRLGNNSVIDAVHYYADWHFALLDDLNGVSLERINYNAASQDKNNWHSAASTAGYATPAYQNSQFGEYPLSAATTITISPKTFSPNNDGHEDFLLIRYKLEQPGYVANIDIYDDEGRIIRKLARNQLLDREGSIIWHGMNDDGNKARIGVYIVIVEVFNLSGSTRTFKEACVLAGKL